MPKSHARLYYHLVWSTKGRQPQIRPEIQEDLYAFVSHKCQQYGYELRAVNGTEDHIHVVLWLGPTIPIFEAAGNLKGSSSRFCNRVLVERPAFRWQTGYAALTVCHRDLARIVAYVRDQKAHHRCSTPDRSLEAVDDA